MKEIKVFISYSHDSEEHLQRVLEFSDRLRDDGVDCCFDQYANGAPHEGWQRWMERQIEAADVVLIVCTPRYLQRFRGVDREGGRGANFEGVIISQLLYDNFQKNTKFIPLIPDDGSLDDVPLMLKSGNTYNLGREYEKLYRVLTSQPQFIAKPLGKLRHYPSTNSTLSAPLKQTDTAREKGRKITKKLGSALQVILLLILSLVLIYGFAPALWEKGVSFYQENFGWTEEARRSNPVGYLKYAREKLQNDLSKIQSIIKDLEVESMRIERHTEKLAEDQGKYEELLNRAKNLYHTAEANPENGYPIKFAGAYYTKDEFLLQIKILLDRNKIAKQQLVELQNVSERIRKALTEMHSKYARAKDALENIDTMIATIVNAKANAASSEVKANMDQIAAVQQDIDVYLGNYESSVPIRSAEDVMKASSEGAEQ